MHYEIFFLPHSMKIEYSNWFASPYISELRRKGVRTQDLFQFINTLTGIENFIRNHPIPIIQHYWRKSSGQDNSIKALADKLNLNITFEEVKMYLTVEEALEAQKRNKNYDPKDFKPIKDINLVKYDIAEARYLIINSNELIQNEELWENYTKIRFKSIRHSSDHFEYYSTYKTGWAYLTENKNIELDPMLIAYLKNKTIALIKESHSEYVVRWNMPYAKVKENGLIAFRDHKIRKDLVTSIINDPMQWEGIFYDENFCNISILEYIGEKISNLNKINWDI